MKKNLINKMEMKPAEQNSSKWQLQQQRVKEMLERYGNARQFLNTFTPDLQTTAAREIVRAYTGTAPTLETVVAGYGEATAIVWLCVEVENLNTFSSVKEKLEVKRQKELAKLILTEYPYLKVSEVLLFFHRLKCAQYGRFYGAVDALFISSALLQFSGERRKEIGRIEEERRKQEEKIKPASGGITYEEYQQLKQQKQQQDENK